VATNEGVDRRVLCSDQAGRNALPNRGFKQRPEHACLAEAAVPVLEKVEWCGIAAPGASLQNQR
jgi:hypothetical protein